MLKIKKIIKKDTLLYDILGQEEIMVNSFHNYHSEDNNIFKVNAISEDNIIEGIELSDKKFILGVQWHPESMIDSAPNMKQLFFALVRYAKVN